MTITDAAIAGEFTHLFCSPAAMVPVYANCAVAGRLRDHCERKVTDLPIVGRHVLPLVLILSEAAYSVTMSGLVVDIAADLRDR